MGRGSSKRSERKSTHDSRFEVYGYPSYTGDAENIVEQEGLADEYELEEIEGRVYILP